MRRSLHASLGFALVALLTAASCGDDAETNEATTGTNSTLAGACSHYIDVICGTLTECNPDFANLIGDEQYCRERFSAICDDYLQLDGITATADDLNSCADAFEQTWCDQGLVTIFNGCEALYSGSKADGEPCFSGGQCAGGSCDKDAGSDCGVCATLAREGEACSPSEGLGCFPGLLCGQDMTCIQLVYVGEGEVCDFNLGRACRGGLTCSDGICVARGQQGAACTTSLDCLSELDCDQNTSTCVPEPAASTVGEPCGYDMTSGAVLQCEATSYCGDSDVCVARVPDGGSCIDSNECQLAAYCIDGVCTLGYPVCQ